MERRGSGMKKIMNEYKRFEKYSGYRAPEFNSNSGEFHVTLWNLNYVNEERKEFANDKKEFANEIKLRKEFVKAQRVIYKLISLNPKIRTTEIAETLNLSTRQVQKYMKRLTELKLIIRTGNRLNGAWKILDSEYEDFFEGV